MAETFLKLQTEALSALPPPQYAVLQVSLDETEIDLVDNNTQHVVMVHGLLQWRASEAETVRTHQIVMPPAFVNDTTAEALYQVWQDRMPECMKTLQQDHAIVMNSDSAKACKRLARKLASEALADTRRWFLQSWCNMHMMHCALVNMLKLTDQINGMFCSTLLVHKASNLKTLRKLIKSTVSSKLQVVYELPADAEENRRQSRALLDMLEFANADLDYEAVLPGTVYDDETGFAWQRSYEQDVTAAPPGGKAARRAAKEQLISDLPGNWADRASMIHYCPHGCCTPQPGGSSREVAVNRITDAVCLLMLAKLPRVPALNRWTKLFQPMVYWLVACNMFFLIPSCLLAMLEQGAREENAEVNEADIIGPETEDSFRRRNLARLRKATTWQKNPMTALKLAASAVCMRVAVDLQGDFFSDSKDGGAHSSFVPFTHAATSPAGKVIQSCLRYLGVPDDDYWQVLRGGSWTHQTRRMALSLMLVFVGGLHLRCVVPFQWWPQRLAVLVNSGATHAEKLEVAEALMKVKSAGTQACCLDASFSARCCQRVAAAAELLEERNLVILQDTMAIAPAHNIGVEDRFARMSAQVRGNRGKGYNNSTAASNHVLAESQSLHRQAVDRRCCLQVCLARVVSQRLRLDLP